MSKTAEEKFKEIGVYPEDFISSSGYFGAVKAANSFAAQEVEAYKKHLREEVEFLNKTRHSWLLNRVLELIDMVK